MIKWLPFKVEKRHRKDTLSEKTILHLENADVNFGVLMCCCICTNNQALQFHLDSMCFDMLIKEGKRRKRRMQMDYLELCEAGIAWWKETGYLDDHLT